jgi:serine/threonine protein kinase
MLQRGDSLGPYQLIEQIDSGNFGDVWRAKKREGISPDVAIKVLHNNNNHKAFQQEAEIWVKLSYHPNVMQIIDAATYGNYQVIVSHYAPEGSLEDWLQKNNGRAPSEKVASELILGILQGLSHLHQNKVIHSDLAPKNILWHNDIPQLIDFGQSKIFTTAQTTVDGNSGTPAYKAPEVYNNDLSPRSDIWSVGVIFYRLVAGKLPFEAHNPEALMKKILMDPIPPLPSTVAKPIQGIIYKALEKDRKDRFQTAEAMIEALAPVNSLPALLINSPDSFVTQPNATDKFSDLRVNPPQEAAKPDVSGRPAISDSLVVPTPLDPTATSPVTTTTVTATTATTTFVNPSLVNYWRRLLLVALIPGAYVVYQYLLYPAVSNNPAVRNIADRPNVNSSATSTNASPNNLQAISASLKPPANNNAKITNSTITIKLPTLKTASAYFNRAIKYQNQGQLDQALADYNQALTLDPKNAAAYNNRGNIYCAQEQLELALSDYNTAITLAPKDAAPYNGRAIVYDKQGKSLLALDDYNRALQLNPRYAYAYEGRGNVHSNQGQLDLALADYQKALQFDPKNPQTYYNRGLVHQKNNQKAAAIADFQKAKSLYKDPQKIAQCVEQLRSLGSVE